MFAPLLRRLILAYLGRQDPSVAVVRSRKAALKQFRRAAQLPAYATLLSEAGINPQQVRDWSGFRRLPALGKHNTFQRFPLDALCGSDALGQLAGVLTSSGQSGSFAFGLSTRRQARRSPFVVDLALEATFEVDSRKTLLINALPMGVGFASDSVVVAETSVREDMVLALADKFGPYFDQIILVTDPLFLKLLCDTGRERGFDWRRFRVNAIIGEETFGEHFRTYVGGVLGTDPDRFDGPMLGASMGVGELGLNLFFETPQTIALRRLLYRDPGLRCHLLGQEVNAEAVPMLFAYSPAQTLVESLPDPKAPPGFGQLAVTMLDPAIPIPLPRYQTGDLVRVFEPGDLGHQLRRGLTELPVELSQWRLPMVALRGRDREEGAVVHISALKDSFYRDSSLADVMTGAFRLELGTNHRLHIQLRRNVALPDDIEDRVRAILPCSLDGVSLQLWSHAEFPFGMGLDYERKFRYL